MQGGLLFFCPFALLNLTAGELFSPEVKRGKEDMEQREKSQKWTGMPVSISPLRFKNGFLK